MYFGSHGNNNLYLAGTQTTGGAFCTAVGYNSACYRCCSFYQAVTGCTCLNTKQCAAIFRSCCPTYVTSAGQNWGNLSLSYTRNLDRPHGFSLFKGNTSSGVQSIQISSPISITETGAALYMYRETVLSNYQNYIGINCKINYGYTFTNWRAASASGTIISTSKANNLYFNGTYGGINARDIRSLYAGAFS